MSLKLWSLSLGIFTAVVGVVAVLLLQIIGAAKSIDDHAAGIWTAGKQIAGNTVSIWMLEKTNDHLKAVGETAGAIATTAGSIDAKLKALAEGK